MALQKWRAPMEKKGTPASPATALASSVFPVPAGLRKKDRQRQPAQRTITSGERHKQPC